MEAMIAAGSPIAFIFFMVFTMLSVAWLLRRGGLLDRLFPGFFWPKV